MNMMQMPMDEGPFDDNGQVDAKYGYYDYGVFKLS